DRAGFGDLGGGLGEPPIHPLVRLPPAPVVRRVFDRVVVQRPEGGVGVPLVVVAEVLFRERNGAQPQVVAAARGAPRPRPGPAAPARSWPVQPAQVTPAPRSAGCRRSMRTLQLCCQSYAPSGATDPSNGSRLVTITNGMRDTGASVPVGGRRGGSRARPGERPV